MAERFSTSVQMRSAEEHKRVKVSATVRGESIGVMLESLVEGELSKFTRPDLRVLLQGKPKLQSYV